MAKDDADGGKKKQPIIIVKRIKKGGDGHHGGAWKVAYADFVTAMMAFFLLLWLLNVTTEEQKNAISNYFDPTNPKVSRNESGAGGVLGGLTVTAEGAMASMANPTSQRPPVLQRESTQKVASPSQLKEQELREELEKREEKKFKDVKDKIEQAIKENAELKEMAKNLLIDITPEGLRIQIVDQEGKPMFPSGSAEMYDNTRALIVLVANAIKDLPNQISIRGHTDAVPYSRGGIYTNWELSADRANASRRVLLGAQIPESKIANVVGKADTDALIKEDPKDARNRRLSIILLRESLTNPNFADGNAGAQPYSDIPNNLAPTGGATRTEGRVKFP